jgi:hypothetical protein
MWQSRDTGDEEFTNHCHKCKKVCEVKTVSSSKPQANVGENVKEKLAVILKNYLRESTMLGLHEPLIRRSIRNNAIEEIISTTSAQKLESVERELEGIDKCLKEIRTIEGHKMDMAAEKQQIYDATIVSWTQTAQTYLTAVLDIIRKWK